jgi:hypothetical protein
MKTKIKISISGILLVAVGIFTSLVSQFPSQMLQFIFISLSVIVGVLGLSISRETRKTFVQSKYYAWIGFILVLLAISLAIWGTSLMAFTSVVGFFLLVLGIIEFVFAEQILTSEKVIPWKLVGIKLIVSAISAIGSVWILTMANINPTIALLFLGLLLTLVGLAFIQISRMVCATD